MTSNNIPFYSKKYFRQMRDGKFLQNLSSHNSVINSLAVNEDGVCASGGDDGTLHFTDYSSGYNFQKIKSVAQPGNFILIFILFSFSSCFNFHFVFIIIFFSLFLNLFFLHFSSHHVSIFSL